MKFLLTLIIIVNIFVLHSFSQTNDAEMLNELSEFLTVDGHSTSTINADTSLILNQIYIPAFKSSYQNVFTGNIGTASFGLVRDPLSGKFLNWGINLYDDYKLGNINRTIRLNQKPYTRVKYLKGSKKEQVLNVTHQQHITKNMIAGLDFIALASTGFYSRQLSKQRSFDVFYFMHSNDNSYKLLASYTSNKHEAQENGGIVNDTLFINQSDNRDAEESLVNLLSAKSLNKDNTYFVKQKYSLLGDGIKAKISDSSASKRFTCALTNSTNYSRKVFVFQENNVNPDFFSAIYFDSVSTYDSSFVSEFVNRFGVEIQKYLGVRTNFGLEVFTNYQDFSLFQHNIDTSMNALDVGIASSLKQSEKFSVAFQGKIAISEKLSESYFLQGSLDYSISNKLSVETNFAITELPSPVIFRLFDSNHFKWINHFENEKFTSFDAALNFKKLFKIRYKIRYYGNYSFYDSLALAKQNEKDINLSTIELSHLLKYKKLHFNGNTSFTSSSMEEVIPVPEIQLYHSLYFEDQFFKVGMPIQIGFDFRYHTKYFAQAYMPATGQRYLQTKQEIGDYLFVDFFFNFKINNSKLFFKIDHLNEGFSKRNYFIMPYHPMMGRSFKVGIKWIFFD